MAERTPRLAARIEGWLALPARRSSPMQGQVRGRGPVPVVLLHGQPGVGADWDRVVDRLETDRFSAVAPDRPGYGRTAGPATGFAGNAAAVVELMDRLGLAKPIVVGHSWGGAVAQVLAAEHPQRVRGLVLVSSVGPGERLGWADRLMAAPVAGEVVAGLAIGVAGRVAGSSRVVAMADRHLPRRTAQGVAAVRRVVTGPSPVWRSFVAEQRALMSELDALGGLVARIEAPTVVLHGSADRVVPVEVARRLEKGIPGARLELLAGARHLLPYDEPAAIAAAVNEVADRSGLDR